MIATIIVIACIIIGFLLGGFIGELLNGAQVEILDTVTDEDENVWYKISTGGKEGFVSADYVVNNDEIKNLDKSSSVH